MTKTKLQHDYRGKKENKNAVESTKGEGHVFTYRPNGKDEREARRRIWDRYKAMRESPLRRKAERRWDLGDKMYSMWAPDRDPDDWRADIILPDGFSAIQTHNQETIQLRPRPSLEGVESSDMELEAFNNHVFQFAMDKTDFDIETHKARNMAAIRGDAFTLEEYRLETREVQDPVSFEDGEIKYKKRKITDYDDVYTRHVDNWACFYDDAADDPKYGRDCIYREVMPHDEFKQDYEGKRGFKNTDQVVPAKNIPANAGFFQKAADMEDNDVEILHYWNKLTDSYDVLANNVMIRIGPMPNRHKELPMDKWTFYPLPGQIYGLGIPQIIYTLVEERRTGRNMAADRNKMQLSKMFLVNDLFDFDEDDLTPRPHGMIKVNTNGLPIQQAIQALEYGDVPMSSIRFDDSLLVDERRAHGLDDRPAQTQGGTATENAIISEAAQKRINLVTTLQNWMTLKSIGRKKWSNIQFFYPAGRTEEIMEENRVKKREVYKTIKIEGKEFKIRGSEKKGQKLELDTLPLMEGSSSRVTLDPTYARFLEGNFDIIVNAGSNIVESKAVKFGRVFELSTGLLSNPVTARWVDGEKTTRNLYRLANESPKDWMVGDGMSEGDMRALGEFENQIFLKMAEDGKVYALPPTPGATEAHTEVHIDFRMSPAGQALPEAVGAALDQHIAQEHEDNPNTGALADKMKQLGMGGGSGGEMAPGGGPEQGGGGNAVVPGAAGGPGIASPPSGVAPVVGGDVTQAAIA